MEISHLNLGPLSTNVYLLVNEETKETLIVDPAGEASAVCRTLKERGLKPVALLLTHGHWDHIGAADALKETLGVPLLAPALEKRLLADPKANYSEEWGCPGGASPDEWLQNLDTRTLGGMHFQLLSTPGHTEGSSCYYFEKEGVLIAGDTLFQGSYGRTDLITGSSAAMNSSIALLLSSLPPQTKVYPGHGPSTTIAFERKYNPLA